VLCRTNKRCVEVATALEQAGVRAALARGGLLATPEAVLAVAALRLLVDSQDSLARAEIVALSAADPDPEAWLADRLAHVVAEAPLAEWCADHPLIRGVDAVRRELEWLTPAEALDRVLAALDLPRVVLGWGRREVRLGNLDALRRESRAYQEHCERYGAAATVAGFLAWLREITDAGEDQQAEGVGRNAVTVSTWHGAKGLEWPVVIVDGLNKDPGDRLWGVSVMSDAAAVDLDNPLGGRWIRYWVWPYGGQAKGIPLGDRVAESPEAAQAAAQAADEFLRLLYVALTRARDVLVLPVRKKGEQVQHGALDRLFEPAGSPRFVLPVADGRHDVPITGTDTVTPTEVSTFLPGDPVAASRADEVWFAPAPDGPPTPREPAVMGASKVPAASGAPAARVTETLEVGPRLALVGDPDEELLGNALHGFLAADDPARPATERAAMATELLRRHAVPGAVPAADLVTRRDELRAALERRYTIRSVRREWPLRVRRGGTTIIGVADLVLETDDGWVVVDHKSFKGGRAQWPAKAVEYWAQLEAYADALRRATGRPVVGCWIHFVVGGGLVRVEA